jgi:Cys-rich repeat protein
MKRLSLLGFVGLMASVLAGCPIWSGGDTGQGGGSPTCADNDCPSTCAQPSDCPQNETCGADGQCHPGDCTTTQCLAGYTCAIDPNTDTASCVPGTGGSTTGTGGTGGTGATTTTTTTGGTGGTGGTTTTTTTTTTGGTGGSTGTPIYCGHPSDCAAGSTCTTDGTCQPGACTATGTNACIYGYSCTSGTCASSTPGACNADSDCASGQVCIAGSDGKGGVCTVAANQCFDQSQCSSGEDCVSGKCILGCTSDTQCRDGYTCNTTTNVCSTASKPCTVTNDCGSASLVCVAGACVPRSGPTGTCTNPGDVWDENGCVPNQAPTFTCQNDGVQDACNAGSICLHHDCWISCATPNQNACATQSILNTCKPVVDNAATYDVCGTSTSLGGECGAGTTGNMSCSGGDVCVDGYCK